MEVYFGRLWFPGFSFALPTCFISYSIIENLKFYMLYENMFLSFANEY